MFFLPFKNEKIELKNKMIEKACDGIDYFLSHDMKEGNEQV